MFPLSSVFSYEVQSDLNLMFFDWDEMQTIKNVNQDISLGAKVIGLELMICDSFDSIKFCLHTLLKTQIYFFIRVVLIA